MPETATTATASRATNGLLGELTFWDEAQTLLRDNRSLAVVDSELTLIVAGPYQKAGWLPNPFHLSYERLPLINTIRAQMMVGRLDGPTPAIARRPAVDDAMETEQTGLTGVFYIDARGLQGPEQAGNYVWFDRHLIHLSDMAKQYPSLKVVLDRKPGVFPPGSCPNAAFYCGWYSLGKSYPRLHLEKRRRGISRGQPVRPSP